MSIILDALKQMDESQMGRLPLGHDNKFYTRIHANSFFAQYKYWLISGSLVLFLLGSAIVYLVQYMPSHQSQPKAQLLSSPPPTPKTSLKKRPSKPKVVVSNIQDPDVNQAVSQKVQAIIHEEEVKEEQINPTDGSGSSQQELTNSIQFSEAPVSEDMALSETKSNLSTAITQGNYPKVIEETLSALPTHSQDVELHYYLGLAYFNMQKYSEALTVLLKLQPSINHYPDYYAVLANVYMHLNAFDNARYLYEALVKLFPEKSSYALGLGIIYQKLGRFELAKNTYKRILTMEEPYWSAYPFVQDQLKRLTALG